MKNALMSKGKRKMSKDLVNVRTFNKSGEKLMKNCKPAKKSAPPKGKMIPDSKPENSYQKVAKASVKARAAGKKK